jgi:hypothetical protein
MKPNFSIIPECYADTNLVETITNSFNSYQHQKGCNNVAKVMQDKFKDSFALGIIDRDKREIEYLKQFELKISDDDLFLYKHPSKHHFIIQISPAIESFILKAANDAEINPEEFNLPQEIEQLRQVTKKKTSRENHELRSLFTELKNRNASQIVLLSKWILYLKENNYNASIEEIKNL